MLPTAVQTGSFAPLKSNIMIPIDTVASPKALQYTEAIHSTLVAGQFLLTFFFFSISMFPKGT